SVATFDFGLSSSHPGTTVNKLLKDAIPITLIMAVITIFITYIVAVPIGILSSIRENTLSDKMITVSLFMLYSLPSFFVAIWLIELFANKSMGESFAFGLPVQWFPESGLPLSDFLSHACQFFTDYNFTKASYWDKLGTQSYTVAKHLFLPILSSTLASYAYLSRQMRGGMLEVLRQDYIRTARAKGLSEKTVIIKHALRNSLIPIITIASSILPILIGGSVIIERVFNIPGMGQLGFNAILQRDYNVIMAVLYLSSILTLVGILISDILYVLVNPRITFD
ncbi:MAG TPA: ABC transporter permease, partial [Spirochaetes bacterium]|nr:ABC transporter permease [Spirochaetota bacterium]